MQSLIETAMGAAPFMGVVIGPLVVLMMMYRKNAKK